MNLQSILLLAIVAIVFLVVGYRYVKRQRNNPGCGSCNCDCSCSATCHNCPGC